MADIRNSDENITMQTVETTELYAMRHAVKTTHSSQPSPRANAFMVAT